MPSEPKKRRLSPSPSPSPKEPPVVHIPYEVRSSPHVNAAYDSALDQHGPVVVIPRHGRRDHVLDHRYIRQALVADPESFSFEKGAAELLNLGFVSAWGDNTAYIHDIHNLVAKNVQPRLGGIVEHLAPAIQGQLELIKTVDGTTIGGCDEEQKDFAECPDLFDQIQLAVAQAMVVLILGESHAASPIMAKHFSAVAVGMADLAGTHESTHAWARFPRLWAFWNALSAAFLIILPTILFGIAPALWKTRHEHLANGLAAQQRQRQGDFTPLFDVALAQHCGDKPSGLAFLHCLTLCVSIIWASVHQTVVAALWTLVRLVQEQDEYLPAIRREWESVVDAPGSGGGVRRLSAKKLGQLVLLDSFIREVMRTRGDTLGCVRQTTRPVQVGPYVIPAKAMCMMPISRAHQHPDNYGTTGGVFDGFQWQKLGRQATQIGPDFLTFGLGKWACPGRQLAVHEIKIVLYALLSRFDIRLSENTFLVPNTINTASVAPVATLLLRRI
ncbi:cytochrome P450 [Apiospora rasikravindrae]|uniref:Cytochrome P450 n=1 Tax=Apiospora rasikravindrae TaxID=990691 RepID=A0ABR1S4N8_9PEZI